MKNLFFLLTFLLVTFSCKTKTEAILEQTDKLIRVDYVELTSQAELLSAVDTSLIKTTDYQKIIDRLNKEVKDLQKSERALCLENIARSKNSYDRLMQEEDRKLPKVKNLPTSSSLPNSRILTSEEIAINDVFDSEMKSHLLRYRSVMLIVEREYNLKKDLLSRK